MLRASWISVWMLFFVLLQGCGAEIPSPPASPTGFQASAGDTQVSLSWNAVSDAQDYVIYYKAGSSVSSTNYDASVTTTGLSQTITGLSNGITYSFVIASSNILGEGATSAAIQATPQSGIVDPIPATPANLLATAADTQVSLSWDSVLYATSYKVYTKLGTTVSTSSYDTLQTFTGSPQIISSLVNGSSYAFIVVASNASGDSAAGAVILATPTATTIPIPTAPTNLQGVAGDGQVSLSWVGSVDATAYNVYYKLGASVSTSSYDGKLTTTATSQVVSALSNGNTYSFIVTASNASGESSASSLVQAVPTSLTGLVGISVSPVNAVVAVGDSVSYTATGHFSDGSTRDISADVYWQVVGDFTWDSNTHTATVTGTSLSGIIQPIDFSSSLFANTFLYPTSFSNEGSAASPVSLTLGSTHNGSVNAGGPYSYYSVATTPGNIYYIESKDTTSDYSTGEMVFQVFDDAGYTNLVCDSSYLSSGARECAATASGANLYIRVDGSGTATRGDKGTSYTLDVYRGYLDESKTISTTSYSGQVGATSSSYTYAGVATERYTVSLTTSTSNLSLSVGGTNIHCSSSPDGLSQTCSTQITSSQLSIYVNNSGPHYGGTFNLSITLDHGAYSSEGTLATPQGLTVAAPYSAQAIAGSYSYYQLPVTAGKSYEISAQSDHDVMTVEIFDGDPNYTTPKVCTLYINSTGPTSCKIEPVASSMLYIQVYSLNYYFVADSFTLNSSEITYANEGLLATPKVLTTIPETSAYSGQVNTGYSYYQIPVSAGRQYAIDVNNLTADVALSVYDDAGLTSLLCSSNNSGTASESCLTPAVSGSNIWIVVDGSATSYGGRFDLTVRKRYVSEASQAAPKDITGQMPYTGETGPTTNLAEQSFYTFSVTPGKSYRISWLSSTDTDLRILASESDPLSPTSWLCTVDSSFKTCDFSPVVGSQLNIVARAVNTQYGAGFSFSITEIAYTNEGSVAAPVSMSNLPVISMNFGGEIASTKAGTAGYGSSYYKVDVSGARTTAPGFLVSLKNQAANADLYVYSDASFTTLLCSSVNGSISDESCAASAGSSALYIRVDGTPSGFGSMYTLAVDYQYISEGAPGASTVLGLATPYDGHVSATAPSYYSVPGVAGNTYTISITTMNNGSCVDIYPDDDGTYTTTIGNADSNGLLADKAVLITPTVNGVYFRVRSCSGDGAVGSYYSVTVTQN